MLTLFGFGPAFGLPDPSPFVMKTDVLLKMANVPYRFERAAPPRGPKGKIPFIEDEGERVGDSTFIRRYLEGKYRFDFDKGLCTADRAQAWVLERMLEDHVYFALLQMRWMDDANFAKGPSHFFDNAPAGMREAGRERVKSYLHGHGIGRHNDDEIAELGGRSIHALSVLLGDKPYLMGETVCGVDATAFGMIAGILTPWFDGSLREWTEAHANLVAHRDRMMAQYYPGFAQREAA